MSLIRKPTDSQYRFPDETKGEGVTVVGPIRMSPSSIIPT